MKKTMLSLLILIACAGCSGLDVQHSGEVPKEVQIEKIQRHKGISKNAVKDELGPAHFETTKPLSILLYGHTTKELRGFLTPKEIEREVYVFSFDKQDKLQEVKKLTLQDGFEVPYIDKETPTRHSNPDFFEQLLKNFGRYNLGNTGDMKKR